MDSPALQRGLAAIAKEFDAAVQAGKIDAANAAHRQALITGTLNYSDLRGCDLIIEAVFENLEIKRQVFSALDRHCKPGAILATNTSYQDINLIAAATRRPADVVGMHFFSPAQRMKLLEVVRGDATADDVVATVMALAKTIGKAPVLARVCYGFIGNRMLRQYMRQSQLCLIEGSTPEAKDAAMQAWGMAMGPNAVGDLAGLDISYRARQALTAAEKGDPKTYRIADALVEMGRLGRKSGAGYYRYDSLTGRRFADQAVVDLIEREAEKLGVVRRPISTEEIQHRLVCALINEGAKILEEGIAQRAGDIDVVYVHGYGFPSIRGGPMFYADSIGVQRIHEILCGLRDREGDSSWEPAKLLVRLANQQTSFSQWKRE
jgi:3-hydroxyacyl-CoA dehydrogenase